jgi:hypothetical protein
MTLKHLPLILWFISFIHSPTRYTESNALEKSMNAQYNFLLEYFKRSMMLESENI